LDRRANRDLFSLLPAPAPQSRWRGVALALVAVTMLIVAALGLLNL